MLTIAVFCDPQVQSRIKALERLEEVPKVEKEAQVVIRFPDPEALTPPILQLDEVSFAYDQNSGLILNKVCLNANLESRICIVGDNGSGKTTLLKILNGQLSPTSGIRHAHRNLAIGYFSQHHVDQLTMNLSPLEFMAQKSPGKELRLPVVYSCANLAILPVQASRRSTTGAIWAHSGSPAILASSRWQRFLVARSLGWRSQL